MMSMWEYLYKHLKSKGIKVYSPGQHTGDCTSPYVVIKTDGTYPFGKFSSYQVIYTLYCYVPKSTYSLLDNYVNEVESYMKELYPTFKSMYTRTPSFFDESVKGHMVSTQYVNYVKL